MRTKKIFVNYMLCAAFLILPLRSGAQSEEAVGQSPRGNNYFSQVDSEIQVRKILVVPFLDNAQGIYSKPITQSVLQEIETSRQFDFIPADPNALAENPDDLVENPGQVLQLMNSAGADTLLAGRILQGPQGIQGKLALYHGKEGRVLLEAAFSNFQLESLQGLESRFRDLYRSLRQQLPFQGVILSRAGNTVTLNIGSFHGAKLGDTASIIQFLSLKRHPKHNFMIASER